MGRAGVWNCFPMGRGQKEGLVAGGALPPAREPGEASLGPAVGLSTEETPWSRESNKMGLHNAMLTTQAVPPQRPDAQTGLAEAA